MPKASRAVVRCLNTKLEISWANSTSIRPSVRTLAAGASAKAKNQNCEASAPRKPVSSDGRQARAMARSTAGSLSAR